MVGRLAEGGGAGAAEPALAFPFPEAPFPLISQTFYIVAGALQRGRDLPDRKDYACLVAFAGANFSARGPCVAFAATEGALATSRRQVRQGEQRKCLVPLTLLPLLAVTGPKVS